MQYYSSLFKMAVKLYVIIIVFLNITSINTCSGELDLDYQNYEVSNEPDPKIERCRICTLFADSFKKGLKRTSKGKFEGGDADWEELKLGPYSSSELRLVEIMESICTDIKTESDKAKCYDFVNEYEDKIEQYWSEYRHADIYNLICIWRLRICCPPAKYGEDCDTCPGYPDLVCGKRGVCDGDGTRTGTGNCTCDEGYIGINCQECHPDYYDISTDIMQKICIKCHESCDGCRDTTAKDCLSCKIGWQLVDGECVDVDECQNENACQSNEYCVNSIGSYSCFKCDKPCGTCSGPTIRGCTECAKGYSFRFGICVERNPHDTYEIFRTMAVVFVGFFGTAMAAAFTEESVIANLLCILFPTLVYASELMSTPVRNAVENYLADRKSVV